MSKVWLAFFAALTLLLGGIGSASAQMHGGGGGAHGGGWHGGSGWHGGGGGHGGQFHGGQFHDGRFHGGRFNNFHRNFAVFIGAPGFWWGAPYYPYYYPYSYYGGSYVAPTYGDQGPATYIQRYGDSGAQSDEGKYWYYCTDPAGYYPQVRECAKGWLKVVPDATPMP